MPYSQNLSDKLKFVQKKPKLKLLFFHLSLSIQEVLLWLLGSTEALAELASTKSCNELVDPNGDNFCPRSGSSSWVVPISIERNIRKLASKCLKKSKEKYTYSWIQKKKN